MNRVESAIYRETYRQQARPGDIVTLWSGDLTTYLKVCAMYSRCVVTLWNDDILLRERDSYLNGLKPNMETIF